MDFEGACSVEVNWVRGSKFGAVNARRPQPGLHLGGVGGPVHVAAPSLIRTENKPRQLAQLRLSPIQVDVERHLEQFRRMAQRSLKPHDTGVRKVKAHVSAGGLAT